MAAAFGSVNAKLAGQSLCDLPEVRSPRQPPQPTGARRTGWQVIVSIAGALPTERLMLDSVPAPLDLPLSEPISLALEHREC